MKFTKSRSPRELVSRRSFGSAAVEAIREPGESLYCADFHNFDFAGRPFVVRDTRELSENAVGDCSQYGDRADSFSFLFWEMAESRQRIYYRHQRRHFDSLAGILAVRGVQHRVDYLQVCFACEGPAHLEPIQLRNFGDVVPGARDGGQPEYSMGKLPVTDGGDLGVGFGNYLPAEAIPYQRPLCSFISGLCFLAELADWQSVAGGNRSDYRSDGSNFYIFVDYCAP